MAQIQCNGKERHWYDPQAHRAGCPYCGVDIDIEPTHPRRGASPSPSRAKPQISPPPALRKGSAEGVTRAVTPLKKGPVEPVVGWLVCIEGPDKGRDYRVKSRRNFVGRDAGMDIHIESDESVSRDRHTIITFDPRSRAFILETGDARGLTYLNGEMLVETKHLRAYDRLEMGASQFVFVPLCGDHFQWDEEMPAPGPRVEGPEPPEAGGGQSGGWAPPSRGISREKS